MKILFVRSRWGAEGSSLALGSVLTLAAVGAGVASSGAPESGRGPRTYTIEKQGSSWRLLRDGQPFAPHGAVGLAHTERIQTSGGNAVRIGSESRQLDRAHELGLAALVSLHVGAERDGFDWNDAARVAAQKAELLATVRRLKDHPAVMMWALGNEIDWIPPGKPYNRKLWDAIDDLARGVKAIDPRHPVMTVVGDSEFERKIQEVARQCPHLDLIGINAYANVAEVAALVRRHWPRPYAVTEWGPDGHWQVARTPWGAPLEQTSTEKAQSYGARWRVPIHSDAACLASFVFLWGRHQEITHTWYGMFDEQGRETEAVEVMQHAWSGKWPGNRAPRIERLELPGFADRLRVEVEPGGTYAARIVCSDPDGDTLSFRWDVRAEVEPAPYAGQGEKPATPMPELVEGPGPSVRFRAPATSGGYRLFVAVDDGQGHVALANQPFFVR